MPSMLYRDAIAQSPDFLPEEEITGILFLVTVSCRHGKGEHTSFSLSIRASNPREAEKLACDRAVKRLADKGYVCTQTRVIGITGEK